MARNRAMNGGPYIVSHRKAYTDVWVHEERHLWADACALMRERMIEGHEVKVAFA